MQFNKCLVLLVTFILINGLSTVATAQDKPMTDKKETTVKSFHIEATINAPIDTCWNAWTDVTVATKWLGATSIGTKASDDYRISSVLPYLSGRHNILEIKKNKSLKLQYFIDGWPAELKVNFENIDGKTKLTIDGSVDTKDAPESIEPLHLSRHFFYFISQSWSNAVRKLRCLLEDKSEGVVIPRQNNDHVINLSIDIDASPEKIFHTLTHIKDLQTCWGEFAKDAIIEAKVGGKYCYGWYPADTPEKDKHDGPGKILKLEKNKLLVHDWYGGQKMAEVSWKLEDIGNGVTRIVFKHSPLLGHSHGNVWSYRSGWTDCLYTIKWYHERGEVEKDWYQSK